MFENDTWESNTWMSGIGLFFEELLVTGRRIAARMPEKFLAAMPRFKVGK